MRRSSLRPRGFTLLEVMIASALGLVVLGVGLVAGMQVQRRAVLEEQTMQAQVIGRAVKELLAIDLHRAGIGMGNAPITFTDTDRRFAIQAWTEPDLAAGVTPYFPADSNFALPAAPYTSFKSDALRLYWGDTSSMVSMRICSGVGQDRIREGASDNFCTKTQAPPSLAPSETGDPDTPAILVNPTLQVACHLQVHSILSSEKINANPGSNGGSITNTGGRCGDPRDTIFADDSWFTMRTRSAMYRVNWKGGTPVLEYQGPDSTTWAVVSRDVERMKVRHAVIDLSAPNVDYRWFPDATAGRPPIDQCTRADAACSVDSVRDTDDADTTDEDRRNLLRRRVREVEITLTIRTRRADRSVFDPEAAVTTDEEGFPKDGFKRRTYTFRITPRNFAAAGQQVPTGT